MWNMIWNTLILFFFENEQNQSGNHGAFLAFNTHTQKKNTKLLNDANACRMNGRCNNKVDENPEG